MSTTVTDTTNNEEEIKDKNDDIDTKNLKNVGDDDMVIESDGELETDNVLNLASKSLDEIPSHITKQQGEHITTLILTNNKLQSLKNLECFPNVETLHLDRNCLTSIDDFPKLPSLKILWLNNNKLENMESLLNILSKNCAKLEYLSLLRNPLCPSIYFDHGNDNRYKRFRLTVLFRLPTITFLNATEVTNEERLEAQSKGKFLQISKPTQEKEEINADNNNGDDNNNKEDDSNVADIAKYKNAQPAAFLGKGRLKQDGRDSEGNRFVLDQHL